MRGLDTVFCHLHLHSQSRYPRFLLCPYCREDTPHEAIVVEAAVNYFSHKLRDFFIETELEIQMGTDKRRADIVLVDEKQNYAAIVECKRIGVQRDGIDQLKSYLCATDTPLGIFANSTDPDDWEFFENLGRNQFKDIASNLFWKNIQGTLEEESTQLPADAETYHKQGLAKAKLEQYNAACADFDNAIRLKPDYVEAYYLRGLMKAQLGFPAAAIADFDNAIQLKPDFAAAYFYQGLMRMGKLEQYDDAIIDFDNAIRIKPDYAEAYYLRGNVKVKLRQYAPAIADFDKVIRIKPGYAEAYYLRGNMKRSLGQRDAAIADYDNAIRIKPDYAEVYYARGQVRELIALLEILRGRGGLYSSLEVFFRGGDLTALLEILRGLCSYSPSNAIIADYDNAIRLKLDNAGVYYNRGNARMSLGQYADAIADYDIAIQLEPNNAKFYGLRADAKVKLEQLAAAIQDYDKAIRLEHDDDCLRRYYRDRGNTKELMGKSFAAIIDFHRADRALKKR